MDFYAVFDQAVELLRRRRRVSYRALQAHLELDNEKLEALREGLLYAYPDAVTEDGQGLVWTPDPHSSAERRQLTVMFCDLVDSTPLASQFDPEEWREVVRAYYETCEKVIARFDGHVGNYLGDGLLVYFGFPRAHEDDAQRAVRAGLGIIEAVGQLNTVISERHGVSLAVRLGCHTGLVVIGELMRGTGHDDMALGDTPNIAARLQGVAAPDTLVIGALTYQLLGGLLRLRVAGHSAPQGCCRPACGLPRPLRKHGANAFGSPRRRRPDAARWSTAELGLLETSWRQVVDGRTGRPCQRRGGDR